MQGEDATTPGDETARTGSQTVRDRGPASRVGEREQSVRAEVDRAYEEEPDPDVEPVQEAEGLDVVRSGRCSPKSNPTGSCIYRVLKNDMAWYPTRTWTPSIGYHHRFTAALAFGTTRNSSRPRLRLDLSVAELVLGPLLGHVRGAGRRSGRRLSENWLAMKISCRTR